MPHVENYEDFHLTEAMADKAITWMRRHLAMNPDRPFLMWWTPGAVHGPHHVAKKWADKYKGKFDDGWDAYQERVFERQKAMGWIPADTKRPPRPEGMPAWEDIPEEERAFQARLMEVYAGFLEHTDVQVGKLIDELEARGIRDNTLVIYILSDNGASAEGIDGSVAELNAQNGIPTTVAEHIAVAEELGGLDAIGGPKMDNMYHAAWAWAGDSPFRYTKLIASDWGGTRTPMVISWPKRIKPDKTPRPQFTHVNDVVPTIYEILGITAAEGGRRPRAGPHRRGQLRLHLRLGRRAGAQEDPVLRHHGQPRHLPRGLDGQHLRPADAVGGGAAGPRQLGPHAGRVGAVRHAQRLLADERPGRRAPEKLEELKALFMREAEENKVLPIGGGLYTGLNPQEMKRSTNTEWTLFEGITRIPESQAPNVRNGNLRAEIEAEVPEGVNGVIFAMGGYAGGVSLYALDGELYYEYSALLLKRDKIEVGPLPAGEVTIAFEMRRPWSGPRPPSSSSGSTARRRPPARSSAPSPPTFTASETFDVGMDTSSPVADDYFDKAPFEFEGTLKRLHFKNLLQERPAFAPAPGELRIEGRLMVETVREESSPRSVGNGGERLLPCAVSANMK
jgi:hypothetical protein